jgi:hypothetical protein
MDISLLGYKFNLEVLILIGVVYLILVGHTVCGCCNSHKIMEGLKNKKEGFVGANTNFGESSSYSLNSNPQINTSSWFAQDMTVVPGKPLSPGVKDFLARKPQPVPLPEGELLLFANTPFKPECCPNTFSNSSGCACMTGEQYNWLIKRGGNNVPYSEY